MSHSEQRPEHREVELKFRLTDAASLTALRQADRLLDQFALSPVRSQDTLDLYWDTPEYALARGGFGLRTRRQNGRWLVTLKELSLNTTDALADRVEVESEWTGEALHRFLQRPRLGALLDALAQPGWPPPAWAQVVLTRRNPRVRIVAPLHQHRDKRDLCGIAEQNGEIAGELSLDTVSIYPLAACGGVRLLAQIDAGEVAPVQTFYELELEATGSTAGDRLAAIAEPLASAFALQSSATGKAESALRLLARTTADGAPAIGPATSMIEAGRAIWRQELIETILVEAGVRCRQDDEAVHDMRVAIRRMRAAYRIFAPYFDGDQIEPYARTLRKTANILGRARDFDVALDLLDGYRKTCQSAKGSLKPVIKAWKAERRTAYATAQTWLTGKPYSRFLADFVTFCHTPGAGSIEVRNGGSYEVQPSQVRHILPGEIFAHYARMRAYETVISGDTPVDVLHQLRIAGKRLRYAVEFVQPLLAPEPAAHLLKKLKRLQDCLGAINDAAILQDRLRSFARSHPAAASLDVVIAHWDVMGKQQRASFADLWADFIGLETRTELALAIASL